MAVPKVKKGCFFCSLRNSTKFFGWCYLVTGLFGLLGVVYQYHFRDDSDYVWNRAMMISDIMLKSMQALFSLFLIIGAYQKEACYIFWWVISNSSMALFSVIGSTAYTITMHEITISTSIRIFCNLVDIYGTLVVYSYYYELAGNLPV